MWNLVSSSDRREADCEELLESHCDCVLKIDRDRRLVDANEAAIRAFAGPTGHGVDQLERIEIEWLIPDVVDRFRPAAETIEAFLGSSASTDECYLSVIARRLDGMKFHADLRVVPTEQDPGVSHILYLRGASNCEVF